jgi:hypothetical protein
MHKKIAMACMALVAFAASAVIPAVASAGPLTIPTGTAAAVGTKIVGTNVGHATMTTGAGNVTCTSAVMNGTVTNNSATHVAGTIESAHFTGTKPEGRCEGPFGDVRVTTDFEEEVGGKKVKVGVPWCVTTLTKADQFEVRGGACSEATRPLKFVLDSTTAGECKYQKASVTGTYTTHPDDLKMTISGQSFERYAGGFLCPLTGSLDMTFTLESSTGVPAFMD